MAKQTLSVNDLMKVADELSNTSIALFVFRSQGVENGSLNEDDQKTLRDTERRLDAMAAVLSGHVIDLIVQDAKLKTKKLIDTMAQAAKVLEKIKKVKQALTLATAVLGLAGAVLSADVDAIFTAIEKLQAATDDGNVNAGTADVTDAAKKTLAGAIVKQLNEI